MFAQDLPWHISLCQLCPAPGHFFDLLIVRKTLFGALQLCPSKENSLKLFLCKSYLTMHFYVPVSTNSTKSCGEQVAGKAKVKARIWGLFCCFGCCWFLPLQLEAVAQL